MRAIGLLAIGSIALVVGCSPVKLRVETPGVEPAQLHTQVVKGGKPTVPSQCATPCDIQLPWGTEQQISIEAPGYYPAQFNITYDNAQIVRRREDECVLRVPLRLRPPAGNNGQAAAAGQ